MLRSSGKKKLSKNVLEMKFMKRTKEKTEIEAENEERQAMFANSITTAMKHQGSRFITEPSYVNIEKNKIHYSIHRGITCSAPKWPENVAMSFW